MKIPKTISIIGGLGKMGELFSRAFEEKGFKVLISDIETELSNEDVAKQGDVVIITVPIRNTEQIINEITPFLKSDAMITDFTSVKINPVLAMKKKFSGEVVGGHPLFGPSAGFEKQNFILCPERKGDYFEWYKEFLISLGINVLEMSSDEHDKNMAVIQCLTHFSSLSLGSALEKLNYDLKFAEKLSSPVYLMRVYGVGRIIAQDEKLYSDIQMENPYSKEMAKVYLDAVTELNDSVVNSDKKRYEKIFASSRKYFGDLCTKSMKVTNKLIRSMNKDE